MKNLSNNELGELRDLIYRIESLIEDTFLHVETKTTKKILDKIFKKLRRRKQ